MSVLLESAPSPAPGMRHQPFNPGMDRFSYDDKVVRAFTVATLV